MKLANKPTVAIPIFSLCLLVSFLWGCTSSENANDRPSSIAFAVNWEQQPEKQDVRFAQDLNCEATGVYTVQSIVYDLNHEMLKHGPDWECTVGTGTLDNVPSGNDAKVVLLGKDADGTIIYRGESNVISLPPGETVDAGTITALYFAPSLSSPADSSEVTPGNFSLDWSPVTGAAEYRIVISKNSNLSDPVVDSIVTDTTYTPIGLDFSKVYYWKAQARDFSGNEGIAAEIRTFNTTASDTNILQPTPIITTPIDNKTFSLGESVIFQGYAVDASQNQLIDVTLSWESSLDGQLGTGTSLSITTLSAGNHQITLSATDAQNQSGRSSVNIIVNAPPVVQITQPDDNEQFIEDQTITFTGSAQDPEDGVLSNSTLVWTSNIDGVIHPPTTLSAGVHTITLSATDSLGLSGSDSLEITVNTFTPNALPVVTITSPADNTQFYENQPITLTGTAEDPEDGSLTLNWQSNLDGTIHSGDVLSVGVHTITLFATDSMGATVTDSITITVVSNTNPVASIKLPQDGGSFYVDVPISFSGSGTDKEDGSASLVWSSSLDGQLSTSSSFNISGDSLSIGTHTITLTATDSMGATGADSIDITILQRTGPSATIENPQNDSSFYENDTITFQGSGVDDQNGAVSLVWTSSLDGELSQSSVFSLTGDSLSAGVHTITLTATDSRGATAADVITLTIFPNDTDPVATIYEPQNDRAFYEGTPVIFSGSGIDKEDGEVSLAWYSSFDGLLSTASNFTTSSLSLGKHTITLIATDSQNNTGSAIITVSILESGTNENTPPVVQITQPDNNSEFSEDQTISFSGSAHDAEDGDLNASALVWTSSIDGVIQPPTTLSPGQHTITLSATDSSGLSGSTSIEITVNTAVSNSIPMVTITSPLNNASFSSNQPITLTGTAEDAEDGSLPLTWQSNLDGTIQSGAVLSVGVHTITLSATDSMGATGTDSITITIAANTNPVATINQPQDGSSFYAGVPIVFSGSGTDIEDGNALLIWSSSLDGQLGTASNLTLPGDVLSVGTHTITLRATDNLGATDYDSITITILPNSYPVATIAEPLDGSSFSEQSSVTFSGSGVDSEDGSASLLWTSSLDGELSQSSDFTLAGGTLSVGVHTITLTATDSVGATDTDSISITVSANTNPVATIEIPQDNSTFYSGTTISFSGSGVDSEDGIVPVAWYSSIDGLLSNSASFSTSSLSMGTHTITLTATDSQGATHSDTITISLIQYINQFPSAYIQSPTAEQTYTSSPTVSLSGSGSDPEDGTLSGGSLVWTANTLGTLGTGTSLSLDFPNGDHTITLRATDSEGAVTSTQVVIHVQYDGIVLTGDWTYATSSPWVEGSCPVESPMTGTCRFRQNGSTFTLVFLSGSTCNPQSLCTYSGSINLQQTDPYTATNSAVINGDTVTNAITFSASMNSASGNSFSEYIGVDFSCQWGHYITFTRN